MPASQRRYPDCGAGMHDRDGAVGRADGMARHDKAVAIEGASPSAREPAKLLASPSCVTGPLYATAEASDAVSTSGGWSHIAVAAERL